MCVYLESAASVADACRSKLSGLLWQPLKDVNEVTIPGSLAHTAALRPLLPKRVCETSDATAH